MLGERISELRRRRKMTQRQLADYLSVSLNSVSLYERNLSTPDDDTKILMYRWTISWEPAVRRPLCTRLSPGLLCSYMKTSRRMPTRSCRAL